MSILLQDLRYGIRLLGKTPAFTVTAALGASRSEVMRVVVVHGVAPYGALVW